MNRDLIKSKVISIIEEYYSEGNPVDESNNPMDFNMDSLDMVELTMFIEKEFNINLPLHDNPIDIKSDDPFTKMIDMLKDYLDSHEAGKL